MSVTVRPYRKGRKIRGWEVDIRIRLENGELYRERRKASKTLSKTEWQRWNRHGQVLRPGETPVLARTGGMKPSTVPTFAQFAPDFLEFCASVNAGPKGANSPAALETKEVSLRIHLLPVFGVMRMDQLHRRDVDRYVIQKTKEGRSPLSIRLDLAQLRRMLAVAKSYELIDKVPDFRVPSPPPGDVVALTPEEAKRLRKTTAELYDRRLAVLFELYLRTGLRRGEALALHPSDFNLEAAQPTVTVSRSWGKQGFGPTKGKKIRVVPLAPSLAGRVDELLRERGLSPRSETEHPFSAKHDTSRPLSPNQILKLVKRAGEAAETRPLHTHMLRHTFGTECARRGVPLLTIKEWMGHVKVATTMRYLHLVAQDHFQWAGLLPE